MNNWKEYCETEEEKQVYLEKKHMVIDAEGNRRRVLELVEEGDKSSDGTSSHSAS